MEARFAQSGSTYQPSRRHRESLVQPHSVLSRLSHRQRRAKSLPKVHAILSVFWVLPLVRSHLQPEQATFSLCLVAVRSFVMIKSNVLEYCICNLESRILILTSTNCQSTTRYRQNGSLLTSGNLSPCLPKRDSMKSMRN